MKPLIVVCDGFDKNLFEELTQFQDFEVYPKSKVTPEELKGLLPRAEGLVIRSATTVDRELLELASKLKYVIRAGEGTDNIDKKACAEKGVKVSNTPGANNNSAAEHAVALMMTLLRKTAWAHDSMVKGEWKKSAFMGNELTGKTIGILGMGRIGKLVTQRLAGFEPHVLFYDPVTEEVPFSYAQKVSQIEDVMKEADIVSLHMPLMKETQGLINKKFLSLMKPTALLVNASRGEVVNEDDLYECLKERKIRGAALDVFCKEPLDPSSKLCSLDNVVLTPHLGGSTEEAQYRVGEMAVHQLKEFFLNNNLLNEVRA